MPFRVHSRHDKASSTSNTKISILTRRYGYVIKKNLQQENKGGTEDGLELKSSPQSKTT